ncbi:O-antigen ligase family protein [Pelotomaculum propionicicum]|uniref:O-antigen ligase family protein n=1 Tax=Pelotomaculum propionicicum TaxID=258475 RepID=UPI0018642657|nr:O-antigen ligase family protein [Pelotomaculum propionicicum]
MIFEREMSVHNYLVAAASLLSSILLFIGVINRGGKTTPALSQLTGSDDYDGANEHHLLVRQLLKSPYFLALAALTTSYGLSFFCAINLRESLFVWLRHLDYLLSFVLVFWTAGMWAREKRQTAFTHWSLITFAVAGTTVAAIGILAGQGIVPLPDGMFFGRLGSTFQYPNSMAAYLMATLLITMRLAAQSTRPLPAGLLAGMGYLNLLAIIGSQSRGVWAMLPFNLALFILGQTARKKSFLLTAGILVIAIALSSLTVAPLVQQTQPNWRACFWTLAGFFASGAAWINYATRSYKTSRTAAISPAKRKVLLGALLVILIIAAGTALKPNLPGSAYDTVVSDNSLLQRFTPVKTEKSFQARLVYYTDAIKMIKERPLSGWGGGGWFSGYPSFQSYNYTSTTVHNHFLQVWVEAGVFGLIAFLVPCLFLCRGLLRLYRIRTTHTAAAETWAIGTAAIALVLHAAIDFDLSFSSIALFLWALLALFSYQEEVLEFGFVAFKRRRLHGVSRGKFTLAGKSSVIPALLSLTLLGIASIHLAACTCTLRTASIRAEAFVSAVQKGEEKAALEYIQEAGRLDRWSAQYPIAQAQYLMTLAAKNPDPQAKMAIAFASLNLARQAVELDSYNPGNHFLLARIYLANGQLEKAISEADLARSLQPWSTTGYEELNSICVNVAVQQLLRGQKEAAGVTLRRVLAVAREALAKKDSLPPRLAGLWDQRSDLALTPALALNAGQAALLLEEHGQSRDYLARASQSDDPKANAVARLWLGVAMQMSGDPSGAAMRESARLAGPEVEAEYAMIKKLVKL